MLNDVVIDRGSSPYLSNLDLFLDGRHVTTVAGDGTYDHSQTHTFTHKLTYSLYRIDSWGPSR